MGERNQLMLRLITFNGVKKYKSVRRAIRRGHMSLDGMLYPNRPYNNRKDRPLEDQKRILYKELKEYGKRINTATKVY